MSEKKFGFFVKQFVEESTGSTGGYWIPFSNTDCPWDSGSVVAT